MGIIYMLKNKLTGHAYIGQTVYSLQNRFYEHVRRAVNEPKTILHKALNCYGLDAFEKIILHDNVPNEQLDELEITAIKKFETLTPLGYNMLPGGTSGHRLSAKAEDEIINLYQKGVLLDDICTKCGIAGDTTIYHVLARRGINADRYKKRYVGVAKIDPGTRKIIELYESINVASSYNDVMSGGIKSVLYGQKMRCKGYYWRRIDDLYEDELDNMVYTRHIPTTEKAWRKYDYEEIIRLHEDGKLQNRLVLIEVMYLQ